jgi:Type II transport protein GspH
MRTSERGAALIDVVFCCGLAGIIAAIAIPTLHATRERDAGRMAARYLAHRLQLVRIEAVRRNTMVAMRFETGAADLLAVYVDGDGDGVLKADIDAGTDPQVTPPARLADYFAGVSLRILNDMPAPDGHGTLAAYSDPVRLGASDLLSFSPLGSATSGTIYLAARSGPQQAVRVTGATGRMRVLWFDALSGEWRGD